MIISSPKQIQSHWLMIQKEPFYLA